jgi:hypothetical protein
MSIRFLTATLVLLLSLVVSPAVLAGGLKIGEICRFKV